MKRPNILFILSDQHNPFIAGFSGNPVIRTPNLDRLAEGGVVFDNAYCQQPLCVPSRMSLLTGKWCKDLGIYDNQDILPANSETLPRILSRNGYATCLIGKGHFNGDQFQGYQQRPYGDLFGQGHQPDPMRSSDKYEHGLGDILTQSGPSRIPIALTQMEICTAEAAKWLQIHFSLHPDQPFFLSLNYDKPHFPINPPASYFEYYIDKVHLGSHWEQEHGEHHLANLVPFVRENFIHEGYYLWGKELHRKTLAAYYGCIEWMDHNIGKVLEILDYFGVRENTLVIYSSDHGEMASEHGAWQKMVFFEESARIPLILNWVKQLKPGRRRDLVGLIDLFPTLCEAAGIEVPRDVGGISLLPYIQMNQKIPRTRIFSESVLIHKPEFAGCMIRKEKWKFNYYLDGNMELYNLQADPQETQNLVGFPEYSDVLNALRAELITFWEPKKQLERYARTPKMPREKHFYPYSNQFILGDGLIVDGRP